MKSKRFCPLDLSSHQTQTIGFLPPKKLMGVWEADYRKMQEQMIHGESPDFNELIVSLTELKDRINTSNWKMDVYRKMQLTKLIFFSFSSVAYSNSGLGTLLFFN